MHCSLDLSSGDSGYDSSWQMRIELSTEGTASAAHAHIDTSSANAQRMCNLLLRASRVLAAAPHHKAPILARNSDRALRLQEKVLLRASDELPFQQHPTCKNFSKVSTTLN
jgi:aminoglycoside phosphotransferase